MNTVKTGGDGTDRGSEGGSGARLLEAFAGASLTRAAAVVVREDGTLDLIGQFADQYRGVPLQLGGLSE